MSKLEARPQDPIPPWRRRWLLIAGVPVTAALVWCIYHWARPHAPVSDGAGSPFLNTRPGVAYVGTARCAECHAQHAASYAQHPMGRSASPADRWSQAQLDAAPRFEIGNLHYMVERRATATRHRIAAVGTDGQVIAEASADVAVTIGSGRQGQSFLIARAGRLFQSPISWYTSGAKWRLSPGFAANNEQFNRRVVEACLFCHVNDAHIEPDTVNSYGPNSRTLEPIGCERCHGPGELHVAARARGDAITEPDRTIVNPARLEPSLRAAVCEQCHLQGQARIVRRGRALYDYRPGLPLERVVSVFVTAPDETDTRRAVSHVEQLHLSRCFRASAGTMGCTTCHDPHVLPSAAERIAWYRGRCMSCHQEHGCSMAADERRRQNRADSCIGCHMPHDDSSNIAHTSITDHRIVRHPQPAAPEMADLGLEPFHRDPPGAGADRARRDLGLALVEALGKPLAGDVRRQLTQRVCNLLGAAVGEHADDLPASYGYALALRAQQRSTEALRVLDALLQQAPRHELALEQAALVTLERHEPQRSAAYWRRLVEVNPFRWENHGYLAQALLLDHQWSAAADHARQALQLNPFETSTRMLLIDCLRHAQRKTEAHAELDRLQALQPARADELRRWFDQLERAGTPD